MKACYQGGNATTNGGRVKVPVLFVNYLTQHLINERVTQRTQEGFKVTGDLVFMEAELFRIEPESFQNTRRNYLIIEFIRALQTSSVVLVSHGDSSLIVETRQLPKMAERKPGLSLKDRKKLIADCRAFNTLSSGQQLKVLSKLQESYTDEKIFGFSFQGRVRFHKVRDIVRLRHIFGLADAVDTAIENYQLNALFPAIQNRGVSITEVLPGRTHGKISTYVDDSRGYPQLKLRYRRKKLVSNDRLYRLVLHYLRVFPCGLLEKQYVKLIKVLLAGTFSLQMSQELPEGFSEIEFGLFPPSTQARLDRTFSRSKKRRCQFYFNLLQSKALCAPVGDDMIEEAYEKHYQSLCRPESQCIPRDEDLYRKLREYGSRVGKEVSQIYDPFTTSLPNQMACIETGRKGGGNLNALKSDGTLVTTTGDPCLDLHGRGVHSRVEPFVIGLFGPPASGKSTAVSILVRQLWQQLAPDMSRENFVFSRSCSSKHWDGYHGQPVVVLDDFGQDLTNTSDLSEFMTLVSLNDYQLPMAELKEKGTKFTSPIIIVTSNMGFGNSLVLDGNARTVIEDPLALWRRFDLPLLTEKNLEGRTQFLPLGIRTETKKNLQEAYFKKHNLAETHWTQHRHSGYSNFQRDAWAVTGPPINSEGLYSIAEERLRAKCDYHVRTFHNAWTQFVGTYMVHFRKEEGIEWNVQVQEDRLCGPHTVSTRLEFPLEPPKESPRVRAHAIPEPLKVRMITVAEKDTKVLQPLQKALWTYLGTLPQFCLTNGVKELDDFVEETLPWFERIEKKIQQIQGLNADEDPLWLSGDYTAATDNFPMWATEALLEGILEHITHEPTRAWARWEVSSHVMEYKTLKKEGRQTSGQLMGSLLSFPLLCFLNDFVVSESGFDPACYLVNGDDVVARGTKTNIESWRALAPRVGLSLSVGKNFIDPDFCTVNSQLFFRGEGLSTGKTSCAVRTNSTISYCLAETQYYWGLRDSLKERFVTRNWRELRKTPRSIHVGRDHGGLGLSDSYQHLSIDHGLAKRVYLYSALNRYSKPLEVRGQPYSFLRIPSWVSDHLIKPFRTEVESNSSTVNRLQALGSFIKNSQDDLSESFSDMTHADLLGFQTRLGTFGESFKPYKNDFDSIYREGKFELADAPSLKWLNRDERYVAVDKKIALHVQIRILAWSIRTLKELWENLNLQKDPYLVLTPDFEDLEGLEFLLEDLYHFSLDSVLLFEEPVLDDSFLAQSRKIDCQFWRAQEKFLYTDRPAKVREGGGILFPLFEGLENETEDEESEPNNQPTFDQVAQPPVGHQG